MLEKNFVSIYTKFKLHFYSKIFRNFEEREASLSVGEVLCVEAIYALNRPTIKEFTEFAQISTPNATYKINCLVKKGYVKKIQNENDRREYYLEVTQKYLDYCGISYDYVKTVISRVKDRFTKEEIKTFEKVLSVINDELMPEVPKELNLSSFKE